MIRETRSHILGRTSRYRGRLLCLSPLLSVLDNRQQLKMVDAEGCRCFQLQHQESCSNRKKKHIEKLIKEKQGI